MPPKANRGRSASPAPHTPLHVTVFASASGETPEAYLWAAAALGKALARAGHVCVNGGGAHGCMGALNTAVRANAGRTSGVIHATWMGEEAAVGLDELRVVDGARARGRSHV